MKKLFLTAVLALSLGIATTAFAYSFYYDVGMGFLFKDVPEGTYYHDAAYNMANLGVMKGVGENKFDPSGLVNRAQLATVFNRYHQHIKKLNEEVESLKKIACVGISKNASADKAYVDAYTSICSPKNPWENAANLD